MNNQIVNIKNMVCPRCIETVREILMDMKIGVKDVRLGEVVLDHEIEGQEKSLLEERLAMRGFELLTDRKSKLIGQIKSLLIEWIHYPADVPKKNFSSLLAEKLLHDYSYLSNLFSSVEGLTIERFVVLQKIEKIKELLIYNQLTLSEIGNQMGYSSVAYLSTQFKNETGMTPSDFKKMKNPNRRTLDSI